MVDRGAQGRTVTDEVVRALGARVERRTRNGEHLASLLEGETRRDQRSRAPGRLDDDDAVGQARNDAVTARKVAAARLPPHRHFGQNRPARLDDLAQERLIVGRIDPVLPAGEHGDGARRQRRRMGTGVDPAREP
jgi:hypothetical protein